LAEHPFRPEAGSSCQLLPRKPEVISMRSVLFSLGLASLTLAENGRQSLYRYAGETDGFHWMSEEQPIAKGPGNGKAQQANVKALANGLKLTAAVPANPREASNSQIYLCRSEAQCANKEGTTELAEALDHQQPLGAGTFVFKVENFVSTFPDNAFPNSICLGLYLYKFNRTLEGNVDGSNELDIEYHNWDETADTTVWVTTWPKVPTKPWPHNLETTNTGIPSGDAFPRCWATRWAPGQSVRYGVWPPVDGHCDPEDCFGQATTCFIKEHRSPLVPTEHMIPAMNLWWYGDLDSLPANSEISLRVSGFKYLPSEESTIFA